MTTTTARAPARATARSPEQVCDLFARYVAARDVDALASLYEPAAQLILPTGREARGPELRAACADLCSQQLARTVRTQTARESGELALLTRTWAAGAPADSGATTCSPLVVRRQPDGRWLAVIDDLSAGAS